MTDKIKHTSDDSFESDVLQADIPVLVDFWAEWCGPCKAFSPILDVIADEYQGKLLVAKLNVDDHQETPTKFGVRGIPTMLFFKNGKLEATKVGAATKAELSAFIDENL